MSGDSRIRRLIVGLDDTRSSQLALEWAARLASSTGAEIVAVHAVEVPAFVDAGVTIAGTGGVADVDLAWQEWRTEAERRLDEEWCEPLRRVGVTYRAILVEGNASALLATASQENADAIVVGRRGRGGFAEIVLGSFSHYVVHHASAPVVVVPQERE